MLCAEATSIEQCLAVGGNGECLVDPGCHGSAQLMAGRGDRWRLRLMCMRQANCDSRTNAQAALPRQFAVFSSMPRLPVGSGGVVTLLLALARDWQRLAEIGRDWQRRRIECTGRVSPVGAGRVLACRAMRRAAMAATVTLRWRAIRSAARRWHSMSAWDGVRRARLRQVSAAVARCPAYSE